jgi:hypothetical protein
MAKKQSQQTLPPPAEVDEPTGEEVHDELAAPAEPGDIKFETDFNVDDEYKIPPLVPGGRYGGFTTNVTFSAADNAIVWDVTLHAEEDIMMSDNETPVDGVVLQYKNWFPKKGDENLRTKTGKMTKRQAKINMIQEFSKKMKINMSEPELIKEALMNAEWIGISVIVAVEIREYQTRLSNQISEMVAN